ncbi:hypothetical protein QFC21_005399 [Naganishia friedmannii]|uniref:Uncharacterized protein n=1 Tax=Naganishia friedmannii TaxID=89922 RepID=A0ACC2VA33_9TREE|nr:hypothetical protein QFC21_005399 [Naganishia friedmannii]
MQYTLDEENGDRSSDGEDGLSSNPLAHPFSNTLYNYGQHTSLPQPWQEASGLAITYPVYRGGVGPMALQGGGNRASSGLYAHEDVLEREIALLEEEDPTSFLDGLVDPTTDEVQSNGFRADNPSRPTISSDRVFSQQRLTPNTIPNTIPGLSQIKAIPGQQQQQQPAKPPQPTTQIQTHVHSHNHSRIQSPTQTQSHNQNYQQPQSSSYQPPAGSSSHQHHHHHGYQPASLSSISGAKDRSLDQLLISFWTHQMDLAERGTAVNAAAGSSEGPETHEEPDEFKTFGLPLARIKKVMKSDPEVKVIFIAELTCRAWLVAESHKRRTLQKSDVASAIGFSDMFDFLIDIVPREEAISKSELGMKRRTARMKEKKEEEKKRKRQEELEDAFAHSQGQGQVQTRPQASQGSRAATEIGYGQGQSIRPNQSGSSGIGTPSIQQHRPITNAQREEDIPPEKRRRGD